MTTYKSEARRVLTKNWVLVGMCGCFLWGTGSSAGGQPSLAFPAEKRSPQAWLQQYLDLEFPSSARHFALYYRSSEEDVVLFSFDLPQGDLAHLLDGRGVLPRLGDLAPGGPGLPEQIASDPGSEDFARKIAALPHALSAAKERAGSAEPREVRLWTGETSAGSCQVCVAIINDKQVDKADVPGGFRIPRAAQDRHRYVIMSTRHPRFGYDTSIWQRWTLAETDDREFLATLDGRRDFGRSSGVRAERLVAALALRGPTPPSPWWKPAELQHRRTEDSEPVQSFSYQGSDDMTAVLVAGRADGVLRCYTYTQCNVLAPDPRDAIPRFLGRPLSAGAREAHYESASNMAGIVFWMRFDLPPRDWETCLAQTTTWPGYAEFAPDITLKQFLETAYHTGAPPWWHPEELQDGRYAQRKTNTKDLADVTVGFGRLGAEDVRVYIGAFSPW